MRKVITNAGSPRSPLSLGKNELVVCQPASDGYQFLQHKTSIPVELEDLFRPCDFERVAAQPIKPIMHYRHAPGSFVLGIAGHRVPALKEEIPAQPLENEVGNKKRRDQILTQRPR